jgi:hypothetical protein
VHVTSAQDFSSPQFRAQQNSDAQAAPKLVSIRAAQGPSSPNRSYRPYKASDLPPPDLPKHERHLSSDQIRASRPPQADPQSQPVQRKHQQNSSVSDTTVSHQTTSTEETQGGISRTMQTTTYASRAISPPAVSTSRTQTPIPQAPPRTSPHRSSNAGPRPLQSVDEKDLRSLSNAEVTLPMPMTAATTSKQQALSSQVPHASSATGQRASVSAGPDQAITSMNIASSGNPKFSTQKAPSASRGFVDLPADQPVDSAAAPVSVPAWSRGDLQPDGTENLIPHHKETSSSATYATPLHHSNEHGANSSVSKAAPTIPAKGGLQSSPIAKLAGSPVTATTMTTSLRKEETSPSQSLKKPHDLGYSQPNAAMPSLTPYPPSFHGHPTDGAFPSIAVPQMYVPPQPVSPSINEQASCEKTQKATVMSPVSTTMISKTDTSVVPPKSITDTSKIGEKHAPLSQKVSPPSRAGTISSMVSTPIASSRDVDKGRLVESKLDEFLADPLPKSAKDHVNSEAASQKIQDESYFKPLIVTNPPLHGYKKIMPFSDEKQQFAVPPVTVMQLTSTVVMPRRENLVEGESHVLSMQSGSKHYKTGSASEKASLSVPSSALASSDLLTTAVRANADSKRVTGMVDEVTQRHLSVSAAVPQFPNAASEHSSQDAIVAPRFPLVEDNYFEQNTGSKVSSSTRVPRVTSLQTIHHQSSLGIPAMSELASAPPNKPSASLSSEQPFQPLPAQNATYSGSIKPSQGLLLFLSSPPPKVSYT